MQDLPPHRLSRSGSSSRRAGSRWFVRFIGASALALSAPFLWIGNFFIAVAHQCLDFREIVIVTNAATYLQHAEPTVLQPWERTIAAVGQLLAHHVLGAVVGVALLVSIGAASFWVVSNGFALALVIAAPTIGVIIGVINARQRRPIDPRLN
ncbi:MAG: hypothetical protein NZ518_04270 [Dehalococcoidia bacterium]|nr:hypothetical protein [Dehalococcoidia bacterium]